MAVDLLPRPRPVATRPLPWRWVAALLWCGALGWFAFVRSARVPLLSLADLGFHELGHLVMYLLPISETLTAAMGSIAQVAVPLGLAAYFGVFRRDLVAAAVCGAWAATSLQNVSVYIADAPYEDLPLIGGEHDWAYLLGPEAFDRIDSAASIAGAVRGAGLVLSLAAAALCLTGITGVVGPGAAGPGGRSGRARRPCPRDQPPAGTAWDTDGTSRWPRPTDQPPAGKAWDTGRRDPVHARGWPPG